jgi:hypothetical protein
VKASAPAKKALTEWLQSPRYDKERVASAMLEIFDRLYGKPLFSFRSLIRVAIVAVVLHIIFITEFLPALYKLISHSNVVLSTWLTAAGKPAVRLFVNFLCQKAAIKTAWKSGGYASY